VAAPASFGPVVVAAVVTGLVAMLVAREAFAHKNGIASMGCDICHSGGKPPTVTLTASPMQPAAGEAVTLTVSVSQTNGMTAGFYLAMSFGGGTLKATESGTTIISGGVAHTMPRTGSGGQTKFQAQWSSPTPAGAVFQAYGLSTNGDGTNRGDGAGQATLALVAGCGAGKRYYLDQDGDGYGTKDPVYMSVLDCTTPTGYTDNELDCDDFHEVVYPGATEVCDGKDNDCNGTVDDGPAATLCPSGGTCQQGKCVGGSASGGASGSDGMSAGGGRSGSGGLSASGGISGSGGVTASGGMSGSGGMSASGGGSGSGGSTSHSGGMSATTGGTSGSGVRGDDPDPPGCAVGGPPPSRSSSGGPLLSLVVVLALTVSRRARRERPRKDGRRQDGRREDGRREDA